MYYEEETLIKSPFLMSFDDEDEEDELGEGGPIGEDLVHELDSDDDEEHNDDGMSWEDEDLLRDEDEQEEIEE